MVIYSSEAHVSEITVGRTLETAIKDQDTILSLREDLSSFIPTSLSSIAMVTASPNMAEVPYSASATINVKVRD